MTEPVLVTGAGSGIGLAIVQALRAAGRPVWAGARRDSHLQQLAGLGAWPLRLDVREPAQVQAAAAAVQAHRQVTGQGLAGLVHNAGVGGIAPLAGWPDDDLLALFDTNVFGPHRLTNALLPALQAAQGRIVCIGSMGGSITSPTMGPYTMSKHALEAYAECLRQELAPHGVAVSIVQPGAVATDIGDNGREGNLARLAATPAPFDTLAAAVAASIRAPQPADPAAPESATNRRHAAPAAVAAVVLQALNAAQPQARYLVGTRWESDRVVDALMARLIDAAQSPSQALNVDELEARLRQAWLRRSG
jgi:NAD(P)-dependent dehydrogenase (short-subunit alcohol dehydrogenase family)